MARIWTLLSPYIQYSRCVIHYSCYILEIKERFLHWGLESKLALDFLQTFFPSLLLLRLNCCISLWNPSKALEACANTLLVKKLSSKVIFAFDLKIVNYQTLFTFNKYLKSTSKWTVRVISERAWLKNKKWSFMPCPFTGRKMFCASPNFLRQPKNLTAFSAPSKTFVSAQKTILLNANHL